MVARDAAARLCGVDLEQVRAVYEFADRVCVVTHDDAKHWALLPVDDAPAGTPAEPAVESVMDEPAEQPARARRKRGD